MARVYVTLGEVQQIDQYAFVWRLPGLLSSEQQYIQSPDFEANGFVFNLRHSTEQNSSFALSLYLHEHRAREDPSAVVYIGLRCVDKSLSGMKQCRVCPAAPRCRWHKVAHMFSSSRKCAARCVTRCMLPGSKNFTNEDTFEYYVCFESLDHAVTATCDLNSSISLSANCQILSGASALWGTTDLSDCTVITENGRTFQCHKTVLYAASPVLQAMFTSGAAMSEGSSSTITVRDADPAVVEVLLRAIYCTKVDVPCQLVVALYKLADQYQVTGVRDMLLKELMNRPLKADAIAYLLPQSRALGAAAEHLTTYIAQQAGERAGSLLQQPAFLHDWQLADLQLLLSSMQLSPIGLQLMYQYESVDAPTDAYYALEAATTWACCGTTPEQQQERIQQWPLLQGMLQLEQLHEEDIKSIRDEEGWQERLERLPGLLWTYVRVISRMFVEERCGSYD